MSRKSALDSAFLTKPKAKPDAPLEASNEAVPPPALEASNAPSAPPPEPPRNQSGALKAMSASLARFSSGASAVAAVEEGAAVAELAPALLDASIVADRFADPTDSSLAALVESMRESGQQVPILVRAHPKQPGRYQIAYGHRRVRAAQVLGRPVRAIVRALSDDELVVAQGKENLERRDLSYIERAFFAMRLETMGFGREVISSAMGVYKPDVSNFIKVARAVPEYVAAAIGPAPKAGGPRWRVLAERIAAAPGQVAETLGQPEFGKGLTDDRFAALFDALTPKAATKPKAPKVWKDGAGRKLARVEETPERFSLTIDRRLEPDFGRYLLDRLPEILTAFQAGEASPNPSSEPKGDRTPE